MHRRTINKINVFYYMAIILLFIWGRWALPQFWPIARWVIIGLSVLFVVFIVAFSKCPHCGKPLSPSMRGNECPHCHVTLF